MLAIFAGAGLGHAFLPGYQTPALALDVVSSFPLVYKINAFLVLILADIGFATYPSSILASHYAYVVGACNILGLLCTYAFVRIRGERLSATELAANSVRRPSSNRVRMNSSLIFVVSRPGPLACL